MTKRQDSFASTVRADGVNRPVKIVYLVPFNNSQKTHAILDSIFKEAYTRWGGISTLIAPITYSNFLFPQFEKWIETYDPDYVTSFEQISQSFINKIDSLTNAIYVSTEKITLARNSSFNEWRFDLWLADKYVPSLSTLFSPHAVKRTFGQKNTNDLPVILTHFPKGIENNLIKNNFGTSLKNYNVTYPVDGLYDTLCFTDGPPPPQHVTGTKDVETVGGVLQALTDDCIVPISRLSGIEYGLDFRIKHRKITESFNIFIGDTALDRINFWNSRHFSNSLFGNSQSLILDEDLCCDDDFLQILGNYLNHFNHSGFSNQSKVCLWSQKQSRKDLSDISHRLGRYTFNEVSVHSTSNGFVVPEESNYESLAFQKEHISYKLFEKENVLIADDPRHFRYFPNRFQGLLSGAWFFDFDIERHDNLSNYSNVVDRWVPGCKVGVHAVFSRNSGRITKGNKISIIPANGNESVYSTDYKSPRKIYINLPSDDSYFNSIACPRKDYYQNDIRDKSIKDKYAFLDISDKGQNLRGIILMFDSLTTAYDCLCNEYWQKIICSDDLYFDMNKLKSLLPRNGEEKDKIKQQHNFDTNKEVNRYLQCSLLDSVENLIARRIIIQIYKWRCTVCGNQNCVDVDSLKSINQCSICNSEHNLPIDFEWTFKINEFVKRSLSENDGMSVLWALGYLQTYYSHTVRSYRTERRSSFYYMPEVDLFSEYGAKKNEHEVDLLCMIKGKFHVVEVKKNAFGFATKDNEIEKFIHVVNKIDPDVALIMCEGYHDDQSKIEEVKEQLEIAISKIKDNIKPHIEVLSIVRSEVHRDTDPVDLLGCFGSRLERMWWD